MGAQELPNLCTVLHLCSSVPQREVMAHMMVQLAKNKSMKGSGECSLCKLATAWLAQELASNATEQEILTELENLCTKLPSQYSAQCQALVSAEGPAIINLLAQEMPDLCTVLHLCSSVPQREVMAHMMVQLAKNKNMKGPGECSLCKLATAWLAQELASNATE